MTSPVIKYVGRTTNFKGKTLWEIVGNLKNFGVGRFVVRSTFERYPEPSFMKIVKVETLPNEEPRKVSVWVEKTFRGHTLPKLTHISGVSYKADYRLVPKNEEAQYCKVDKKKEASQILPTTMDFPPLLKESVLMDYQRKGVQVPDNFKMKISYHKSPNRMMKIAAEDEKPTIEFPVGLGTPVSPNLYKGVKLS